MLPTAAWRGPRQCWHLAPACGAFFVAVPVPFAEGHFAPLVPTVRGQGPLPQLPASTPWPVQLSMSCFPAALAPLQGLEPTLALLGLAGKRLSPGDPDKSVPRPPPIPWWDDMR